jgi:hypothetical protein
MTDDKKRDVKKGTLEFINVVKDYGTGEPAVKGISFRIADSRTDFAWR